MSKIARQPAGTNTLLRARATDDLPTLCGPVVGPDAPLIAVTYDLTATEFLTALEPARQGDRTVVIDVSQAEADPETETPAGDVPVLRTPPDDLTELGVRINEHLTKWGDLDDATVLCFGSLTALLQYIELDAVFQFLHVLTRRVRRSGTTAYYHIYPDAHDDRTHATLRQLFDSILEYDPESTGYVQLTEPQ